MPLWNVEFRMTNDERMTKSGSGSVSVRVAGVEQSEPPDVASTGGSESLDPSSLLKNSLTLTTLKGSHKRCHQKTVSHKRFRTIVEPRWVTL